MTLTEASQIEKIGRVPQLTMIAMFVLSTILYDWKGEGYSVWDLIGGAGMIVFTYCIFLLYGTDQARLNKLITGGVFKYTRHPMYTGIFLMNLQFWLPEQASHEWHFYVVQFVFMVCLIAAGWFQEKETLARFGRDAEEYYAKTPRLFIFYPFMSRGR
jgi:protein-S-isoprenylcysteine O-methyltransferase Ste14